MFDVDVAVALREMGFDVIRVKAKPAHTGNILEILRAFLPSHIAADFSNKLVIVSRTNVRWNRTGIWKR